MTMYEGSPYFECDTCRKRFFIYTDYKKYQKFLVDKQNQLRFPYQSHCPHCRKPMQKFQPNDGILWWNFKKGEPG